MAKCLGCIGNFGAYILLILKMEGQLEILWVQTMFIQCFETDCK